MTLRTNHTHRPTPSRPRSGHGALALAAACGLVTPALADTSASGGSSVTAVNNSPVTDSNTWRFSTPSEANKITFKWESWADEAHHGPDALPAETKFTFPGATGKLAFAALARTLTGQNGSTSVAGGVGSSTTVPGGWWGTNHVATWTVTATGTIGAGNVVMIKNWDTGTTAADPWTVTVADLGAAGVVGPNYSLFSTISLDAGSHRSPHGRIHANSTYETVSGEVALLDIDISRDGVAVTSAASGAYFYLLDSLGEGPSQRPERLTSLSAIEAMLEADLADDDDIDSSLAIGIVWGTPIPGAALDADGTLARVHVSHTAHSTVDCPTDINGDGFADGIDADIFFNLFDSGDPGADFNRDGFVDGIDADQFNNMFENGCW